MAPDETEDVIPTAEERSAAIDALADTAGEELVTADGFDEAIIGVTDSWSGNERVMRVVYSLPAIINKLVADGMDKSEALEYFEFNIAGAYVGPHTPIYVTPIETVIAEHLEEDR